MKVAWLRVCLVIPAGLLPAAPAAHAQAPTQAGEVVHARSIGLGGRGWTASEAPKATSFKDRLADQVEFSARAGLASDYIYRGTTLSDRKPAVGAGAEVTIGGLMYAGVTAASVKLPTQPSGEITIAGGLRPSVGNFNFDLGVTYFLYPGETPGGPTNGIEYYEAAFRTDTRIGESLLAAGGFAYSPNVSNTGAWSWYAAAGLGYQVPARLLPLNVEVLFTTAAGYSWFGHQSAALGGFRLPDYLNWQAGVTFTRSVFNLDLRYYDTNLSKEDCFVFTGDPNAQLGGRPNPITNPDGMTSRWCSATFVAKAWFALN